ncbi:MAG TPA: nuclear transport factor 2 family protein [Chitinophagaceae bacterium]|jgi:hypothetical protein|nr:nuclear transport factor 2 family protein [Chitinophagaceae bacterium]
MKRFFSLLLATVMLCSCKSKPDLAKEKKAILAILQQERKAHFDGDVELFISGFADSMVSVSKGMITTPTREEYRERFGDYFSKVKFIRWDDVNEPVIRFSDDASLAYAIIQKEIILSYPGSPGKTIIDTTAYAWVSIYRKLNGVWKGEVNVSTNK